MESEDRKPIFTKRLILTILAIILIILIILLLLKRCGKGNEEVTEVTISPLYLNLAPGETGLLSAVTTSETSQIYWTSADETCATVTGQGTQATVLAGNKGCTTTITARTEDNAVADCQVTVSGSGFDKLEGIQLNKSKYTVYVGKSVLASVSPAPTTAQLPELYYSIDDTSIATVNENGVIKGVAVGTTTLRVTTDSGMSTTATVSVVKQSSGTPSTPSEPTHVKISGLEFLSTNDTYVCVGQQILLGYKVKPDNASEKRVDWTINDPTDQTKMVNNYARVDENGYVTGIKAGTVTITITSKEDNKIFANSKINVLSSSDSKCKSSSGGPSSPSKPTPKNPEGESAVATAGMTCKVTYKKTGDWYTKFVVTWIYNPGLSDDGYADRSFCINGSCSRMTSNQQTYVATSGSAGQRFGFQYKDKNGQIVTGNCNPYEATKVDSQAPTCKISASKVEDGFGKIRVSVNGSDDYSGITKMSLNDKNFSAYGTPEFSASESIETYIDKATVFSGIVYDEAGNKGTCVASVNPDGTTSDAVYIDSVVLLGPASIGKKDATNVTGHFYDNKGHKIPASCDNFSVNGTSDWQCTDKGITIRSVTGNSKTVTVTLSTNNTIDGKTKSKTISINVNDLDKAYKVRVSCPVSGEKVGNYYKGTSTVSCTLTATDADGNALMATDYQAKVYVCVSKDSCTPNATSATFSQTGVNKIYYRVESKDLGNSSGFYGYASVDNTAPTCSTTRNKDGKYVIRMTDEGSGIAAYRLPNANSVNGNGSTSISVQYNGVNGGTVAIEDRVGNAGSCKVEDAENVTLKYLHLSKTNVVLEQGGADTILVSPVDSNGNINSTMGGITVSGGSGCFGVGGAGTHIAIKATDNKTCDGKSVVVTSTYDNTIKATFYVTVRAKGTNSCTLSVSGNNISISGSRRDSKIQKTVIAGGPEGSRETTSRSYNPAYGYTGIVYYADGNSESCHYGATAAAQQVSFAINGGDRDITPKGTTSLNATLTGATATRYSWTSGNAACATVGASGSSVTVTAKDVTTACSANISATAYYTDSTGVSKTITKSVTINVRPAPPTYRYTCALTYNESTKILAVGASTTNPSATPTSYKIMGNATRTINNPGSGTYTAAVGFSDGHTATCSKTITAAATYTYRCTMNYNSSTKVLSISGITGEPGVSIAKTVINGRETSSISNPTSGGYTGKVYWGNGKTADCSINITVPAPAPLSPILTLGGGDRDITPKSTTTLNATLTGATATSFAWTSGSTSCATVGSSGSSVTVTAKDVTASCTSTITVRAYYVDTDGTTKSVSKSVGINVRYTAPTPPTPTYSYSCSFSYDKTTKKLTLNGTSTNPSATPVASSYKINGASTRTISSPSSGTFSGAVAFSDGGNATCSQYIDTSSGSSTTDTYSCTISFDKTAQKVSISGTTTATGTSIAKTLINSRETSSMVITSAGTYNGVVYWANGKTANCSKVVSSSDIVAQPSCSVSKSGSGSRVTLIASITNAGTGVNSTDSTWSKASSSYTKVVTAAGTYTFTFKDKANRQAVCSATVNAKTQYQVVTCADYGYGTPTTATVGSTSCTASGTAGTSYTYTTCSSTFVSNYTRKEFTCTSGSYSAGATTNVATCTPKTKAEADSSNSGSYWTCTATAPYNCGTTSTCFIKKTYNRSGCATYSSTASSTNTVSSCGEVSGMYYKTTCTANYSRTKSTYTATKCNSWKNPSDSGWSDTNPPQSGCTTITCNKKTRTSLY